MTYLLVPCEGFPRGGNNKKTEAITVMVIPFFPTPTPIMTQPCSSADVNRCFFLTPKHLGFLNSRFFYELSQNGMKFREEVFKKLGFQLLIVHTISKEFSNLGGFFGSLLFCLQPDPNGLIREVGGMGFFVSIRVSIRGTGQ